MDDRLIYHMDDLHELPDLTSLHHIKSLNCNHNILTFINGALLPPNLEILECIDNRIEKIFNLPESVIELYCNNNFLNSLENLPNGLLELHCENNNITNLDYLPPNLKYLYTRNNKLQSLDNLPNSILYLDCCNNQLVTLENLPLNIQKINTTDNLLKKINIQSPYLDELILTNDNNLEDFFINVESNINDKIGILYIKTGKNYLTENKIPKILNIYSNNPKVKITYWK